MFDKILNNTKFFVFAVVWVFIFFAVIYFHPTSEYMSCNYKYTCEITHEYFHKFKFRKIIQLNQNSLLSYKLKHRFISFKATPISNSYYLYYDNKSPFIYYFYSIYGGKEAVQNEIVAFKNYKMHPQSNYYVKSKANSFNSYIYFIGFIIMFILFIYTYLEDNKSKNK